jgi:hypothetical protein
MISIWMGDHLGNRGLLAFPALPKLDANYAEVNLSKGIGCRQMQGETPITIKTLIGN